MFCVDAVYVLGVMEMVGGAESILDCIWHIGVWPSASILAALVCLAIW